MRVQRNVAERSCYNYCTGQAISVGVFVDLCIQHAMRVRRIILSPVTCLALLYFSTLSYKRLDFRKKLLNIKCVLISFTISVQKFLT